MTRDAYSKTNRNSILCPNCRWLISLDEERCPHCGLRNPGSRWRSLSPARAILGPDRIIFNLIGVNAAMFLLSILINPRSTGFSMNPLHLLSPDSGSLLLLGGTGTLPLFRLSRWWTLLSANYLHGGILHIFFNMMALWQIGPFVIQEYGSYRMFSIYTLAGVGGFLVSCYAGVTFTIGASAAVCGLIGAALYFGKSRGGQYGQMVYQQVGGWAIGIFLFGFLVPGINNWAHGGGLVFGALAGFLLGYQERGSERFAHKLIAMICVLGTLYALVKAVAPVVMALAGVR